MRKIIFGSVVLLSVGLILPADLSAQTSIAGKCGVNTFGVNNECGIGAFKTMYVQCHDGYEEKQGGETSCKSSPQWREYAKQTCENRCSGVKNIPSATQTSPVSPVTDYEKPTAVLTETVSACRINDDLTSQYDMLISELQKTQITGDKEREKTTTEKILELKQRVSANRARCNASTLPSATVSSTAESIRPTIVQSAREINNYYKARIENITVSNDSSAQIEKLKELKQDKDKMVGELIKNRSEIESSELNTLSKEIRVSNNEITIDNVAVETTGKKILLNVGNSPVSVESNKNNVIIRDKNLEIKTGGVSIKNNTLVVGNNEVKISASQVAEKLNINPSSVELTEQNSKPVYKMETTEPRKLFGFISSNIPKTQITDAENGDLLSESRPWYYFLTTK